MREATRLETLHHHAHMNIKHRAQNHEARLQSHKNWDENCYHCILYSYVLIIMYTALTISAAQVTPLTKPHRHSAELIFFRTLFICIHFTSFIIFASL